MRSLGMTPPSPVLTVKVWSDGMFRAVATCHSLDEAEGRVEQLRVRYPRGRVEGGRGVVMVWPSKRHPSPKQPAGVKRKKKPLRAGGAGRSVWTVVNNVGRGHSSR
jgi:hypothetical protein